MEKFAKENQDLAETTKDWSRRHEPLKRDKHGMYSTGSLTSPYCFAAAMLCRLFGMPNINKFSSEWLPLLDAATNATIVDWAKIFSDNLVTAIVNYRCKSTVSQRIYPPFYLSAYVMDAICYVSKFPLMGWKWTTQDPLFMFIIKNCGILSSLHSSIRFLMESCCPYTKCCMIKMLQDVLLR